MYHHIVRSKVQRSFAALNRGDKSVVVGGLHPDARYRFVGEHALGGERTSAEGISSWFDRVFRLFPDLRFDVRQILVEGLPNRTRVMAVADLGATVLGQPYTNVMMQVIELRWGRITSIETLEDTAALAMALAQLEGAGSPEAGSPPLVG